MAEGQGNVANGNLIKGAGCGTRQWREDFVLTDTDGVTPLFKIAKADGAITAQGVSSISTNLALSGTLSAAGTSTLAAVNASGTVAAAGAMTVGTTLGVTGQATFTVAPIVPIATPATAGAAGVAGQIKFDSGYIYVCSATNTWLRAAVATW